MDTVESTSVPSSISFIKNKPVWDFARATAFPMELPQGSKHIPVYAYMTPYEPDELKAVLKHALSGYKRKKRDVEIVAQDEAIYKPLCDTHLTHFGNMTGTPEQQLAWLTKYSELKPAIVRFSLGGLTLKAEEEDSESTMLDISLDLAGQVDTYQDIYDPVSDQVHRIEMTHKYVHPTESQYREYRGARKSNYIRKSDTWAVIEQHSKLESLYDAVIEFISNAAVNGVACSKENKSQWVAGVPLWHKLLVVDQIFGEILEKNG